MEITKWKKLSENLVYSDFRKILRKKFLLPNNKEKDFDIVDGNNFATIVAITLDNHIILTKQFRPGTEEIYDEIPGGFIDDNETPLDAAIRELSEETGYKGEMEYVGKCHRGVYYDEIGHVFVAKNCIKVSNTNLEDSEFIEVIKKPLDEFRQQLKSGKLSNVNLAYMALDHLGLL